MWLKCSLCSKNCVLPYSRLFSSNSQLLELPITRTSLEGLSCRKSTVIMIIIIIIVLTIIPRERTTCYQFVEERMKNCCLVCLSVSFLAVYNDIESLKCHFLQKLFFKHNDKRLSLCYWIMVAHGMLLITSERVAWVPMSVELRIFMDQKMLDKNLRYHKLENSCFYFHVLSKFNPHPCSRVTIYRRRNHLIRKRINSPQLFTSAWAPHSLSKVLFTSVYEVTLRNSFSQVCQCA